MSGAGVVSFSAAGGGRFWRRGGGGRLGRPFSAAFASKSVGRGGVGATVSGRSGIARISAVTPPSCGSDVVAPGPVPMAPGDGPPVGGKVPTRGPLAAAAADSAFFCFLSLELLAMLPVLSFSAAGLTSG